MIPYSSFLLFATPISWVRVLKLHFCILHSTWKFPGPSDEKEPGKYIKDLPIQEKKAGSSSTMQLTLTSRFQRVISTLGRKTFKTQPLPEPQPAQVRTNVLTWISEKIDCWAMEMKMVMDGRSLTHHSQVQWPKYMQPQRHSTVWSLIDFNHSWNDQPHTCLNWQLWIVWSTFFLLPLSSQTSGQLMHGFSIDQLITPFDFSWKSCWQCYCR